jgi:hypothetical protein
MRRGFFLPLLGLTLEYTMRKLRELLEWIFVMMDLYDLISTVIDFIVKNIA